MASNPAKPRGCFGDKPLPDYYERYHDEEWGVPVYDERLLFEMLILEGAQAGLSWDVILRKRAGYQRAFHQFDVDKVAVMTDDALEALRHDSGIVRNRLKIYSVRKNAFIFKVIQSEFHSFSNYLWAYVDHKPIIGHWQSADHIPSSSKISDALSKDLKKRGFRFVGPTIVYAFMQAVGMVNDHLVTCHCYERVKALGVRK